MTTPEQEPAGTPDAVEQVDASVADGEPTAAPEAEPAADAEPALADPDSALASTDVDVESEPLGELGTPPEAESAADAEPVLAGREADIPADAAESNREVSVEADGQPDGAAAPGSALADRDVPPDDAESEPVADAEPGSAGGDGEPGGDIGLEAAVEVVESEPADLASESAEDAPDSADEESGEVALTASDLPDLTEDAAFHAALEALLLVVDAPAEEELLADTLDQPVKRVREALVTMSAQYLELNRGIDLRNVGGGWRFYTRDRFAPFVEKLLLDGQRAKLTRAALESLAVIAYRQPVTRSRVAAVRGVNVDGVIRTLLARGLIEETGTDKDTGGILYRTTELFLERLGLSSLEDLPPIAPLLPEVDAIDDV